MKAKCFSSSLLLASVNGFTTIRQQSFERQSKHRVHLAAERKALIVEDSWIEKTFNNEESTPFPDRMTVDLLKDCEEVVDEGLSSIPSLATDIIRDLDGCPLSIEYFCKAIGIANVESYTCPEKDAFRGFMSNACRVHLFPGGETVFYKRVVFEHLDHAWEKKKTAPFKLVRDAQSYEVVASFLASQACRSVAEKTGVRIPKCYNSQQQPNFSDPIKSKYNFLLEDLAPSDGWYQQWLLHDVDECKATLSTLAKIHAFFWHGSSFWDNRDEADELEAAVWKSGSYVQPKAQQPDQCSIVAREWETKKMRFENELSSFDYWNTLGERLQSIAGEMGRLAHPFADEDDDTDDTFTNTLSDSYKQYRTFTHGDPKQANLFFRRTNTIDVDNKPKAKLEVGLIDFQWCGFGLAATDIAHFLSSAVHADRLNNGGEDVLLKYYFDELQAYLVEYGVYSNADDAAKNFSFDTFIDQYEIGILDLCRLVIAYTWDRFEFPVEKEDKEGCAQTMNKTSYNKSLKNAVWLMSKCDELMKARGI